MAQAIKPNSHRCPNCGSTAPPESVTLKGLNHETAPDIQLTCRACAHKWKQGG